MIAEIVKLIDMRIRSILSSKNAHGNVSVVEREIPWKIFERISW